MDAFDYGDHFWDKLLRAYDPRRPLQVEFQPGVNCDLYRCPYCYGHGQTPMAGPLITPDDVSRVLDDLEGMDPFIEMSGITTEPLTHPDVAAIIGVIRERNFRLGIHTKGYRLDEKVAEALTQGTSECFVSVSVDAANNAQYMELHDIPASSRDAYRNTTGEEYFNIVKENMQHLYRLKNKVNSPLNLRATLLLFNENLDEQNLREAIEEFSGFTDLVRLSVAQVRNDGEQLVNFPQESNKLLNNLAERLSDLPNVRVLTDTANASRDTKFRRCHAQQFQAVIDKGGNVFPCPQVTLVEYEWLHYGNIKTSSLKEILGSKKRFDMFDWDVTQDMKCRICDRKDEGINVKLDGFRKAFPG